MRCVPTWRSSLPPRPRGSASSRAAPSRCRTASTSSRCVWPGRFAAIRRRALPSWTSPALQDRFGRGGTLTRIDLRLKPGVDAAAAAARLAPTLPAGVTIGTPRSNLESTARLTRAYRVNLDVLALVALFTGGLLVFSTQALAVLRRRLPFALLRSLGLTRKALVRLVLAEGAVLGAVGALSGLAGGAALAAVAIRWFGLDLGRGSFAARRRRSTWTGPRAAMFAACGVAAAVLGSYVPAREAARASPAAALKAGDVDLDWGGARHAWPAVAALGAGAACTLLPPVADLATFRLSRDRAPAARHAAPAALRVRSAAESGADAACARGCAGARAVAPRPGAVDVEPCGNRRRRVAHGGDGDHGRVVSRIASDVARAGAAGRRVSARGRGQRHGLSPRRSPDAHRGNRGRRACRVPARSLRSRSRPACRA